MLPTTLFIVLNILMISSVSYATTAKRLSQEELITEADRIVKVVLKEPGTSAWDSKHKRIYTTYTFEVREDLAGTGDITFDLVQPGGEVDGIGQRTDGFPTFTVGEEVVLFLRMTHSGHRVVGLSQGVFELQKDDANEKLVQRIERLHLVGGDDAPLRFDRATIIEKIQKVWVKKKVR